MQPVEVPKKVISNHGSGQIGNRAAAFMNSVGWLAGPRRGVRWMGLPVMSPGDLCRKLNVLVALSLPPSQEEARAKSWWRFWW